jgi:uncharacterized protein
MPLPLMPKATAVWLLENTTLTFRQISEFTGLHELEVNGIADGEVAQGVRGFDPVANLQLTQAEIKRCEADRKARLQLFHNPAAEGETKRQGPRYTPLSKRQDRPAAIAWLVKFHPELADGQIAKLVGTTKPTIQSIRERTHWNMNNIQPVDPVALGMCKQGELDNAVAKAAARRARENPVTEDKHHLMSTAASLAAVPLEAEAGSGETDGFALQDQDEDESHSLVDADSLFNLPNDPDDE